jgi:DnaJ-class molecular chaperone
MIVRNAYGFDMTKIDPNEYEICPVCKGVGTGDGKNKPQCDCCGGYGAIPKKSVDNDNLSITEQS